MFPRVIEKGFRVKSQKRGAKKSLKSGKLIWLIFEIDEHYAHINTIKKELYRLHLYLSNNLPGKQWHEHMVDVFETAIHKQRKKEYI